MATNPSLLPENVGRLTAPDANYPYGSAKNDSTGTTGDGTPIRAPLMNDTYGFYQALLTRAGIVPSGDAETAVVSQLADAIEALIADAAGGLPFGYFSGFTMANNSGAPNTTIDVAAGSARSSGNTVDIALTGTLRGILQSSGAWAAGDNQNKLDAGAKAINSWYHVFAIRKTSDGTGDILFSLSPAAPTMPSGYAGFRRIGAVKTDGSGNILAFTNVGDEFIWKTLPLDVNVGTSTDTDYVISVPTGVRTLVRVGLFAAGGDSIVTIRPTDSTAYVPSYLAYVGGNIGVSVQVPEYYGSEMSCLTDTLGRIRVTAPAAANPSSVRVVTYSYRDMGR